MILRFKKGTHRARPLYWLRWFPILFNPKQISRKVVFTHQSKYWLPGIDQQDHNKLFGVGFMHPKKDSARFGWRFDTDTRSFVLSAFIHSKGQMEFTDLGSVNANTPVTCRLSITSNTYIFEVLKNGRALTSRIFPKSHNRKWAFLLGPYFGGNRPAPDDLKIELV